MIRTAFHRSQSRLIVRQSQLLLTILESRGVWADLRGNVRGVRSRGVCRPAVVAPEPEEPTGQGDPDAEAGSLMTAFVYTEQECEVMRLSTLAK